MYYLRNKLGKSIPSEDGIFQFLKKSTMYIEDIAGNACDTPYLLHISTKLSELVTNFSPVEEVIDPTTYSSDFSSTAKSLQISYQQARKDISLNSEKYKTIITEASIG
jgi:hypothetical protein